MLCCSFQLGLWPGMALSAVDTVLLRGNAPWTLHHRCVSLAVRPHSLPVDALLNDRSVCIVAICLLAALAYSSLPLSR